MNSNYILFLFTNFPGDTVHSDFVLLLCCHQFGTICSAHTSNVAQPDWYYVVVKDIFCKSDTKKEAVTDLMSSCNLEFKLK